MLGGGPLLAKLMSLFLNQKEEAKPAAVPRQPAAVPRLPEELYLEIFLRLPVQSTFTCKCVSKTWFKLISNPDFVKLHLNHTLTKVNNNTRIMLIGYDRKIQETQFYTISKHTLLATNEFYENAVVEQHHPLKSMDNVYILGSCNGLVCLGHVKSINDYTRLFSLWNPATREYRSIPAVAKVFWPNNFFCYDCKNDDYKLVCVTGFPVFHEFSFMYVYTMRSNSWKTFRTSSQAKTDCVGVIDRVFVNGALHWIAKHSNVIVSFNISDESFKEIQLPGEIMREEHLNSLTIRLWEGCLCVVLHSTNKAWVMHEYGVWEPSNKSADYHLSNHRSLENDVDLEYIDSRIYKNLVLYGPKHSSPRRLKLRNLENLQLENYVESLVSLSTGTYSGRTEVRGTQRSSIWRRNRSICY